MDDFATGYMAGQDGGGGNNGGWGGFGEGLWAVIILAMLFNGGGWGGFGGFGGGGFVNGALTRAELYDGFAIQNIDSAVRGVQNGISDATYALNNAITSGFAGVDRAVCDLGYAMKDCCCQTQRAIDGVNFNMAKGFCDIGNVINMQTRDIIDNQNANYRGIMDFLVSEKLASKDAQIADLRLKASQADQNAVIRAAIDASTAEIIRRTGNECPVPAYWVNAPAPVQVPCGWAQNAGNYGACGCGCG